MAAPLSSPWADGTREAELRRLWPDLALSANEIGSRLGLGEKKKNAVLGKAHRLDLPPRPSPLGTDSPTRLKYERKPSATLPPLLSAAAPTPRPVYLPRPTTCSWPIGDPGTPAFHYCEAPAPTGHSYCAEHAKKAYVRRVVVA